MVEELMISKDGGLGIITLNRPAAINALSRNMIDLIYATLSGWLADETIHAVLLEGAGTRGFCAGGDVRYVRASVLEEQFDAADAFFAHEYALNKMIATSPKPIVALTHGVVMGGGIGLAGHAQIRVTTHDSKFGMPETAIGLMCDVGVNTLLSRASYAHALAFSLSGLPVGAGDALALGLTDYVISTENFSKVRSVLVAALSAGKISAVPGLLEGYLASPPAVAPMAELALALKHCFEGETVDEIVSAIADMALGAAGNAEVKAFYDVLLMRCPTSMEVNLQSLRAAFHNGDISAVLANDLRLAPWMVRRADFSEGVRAVLVDRDHAPRWVPANACDVDKEAISNLIK